MDLEWCQLVEAVLEEYTRTDTQKADLWTWLKAKEDHHLAWAQFVAGTEPEDVKNLLRRCIDRSGLWGREDKPTQGA